MMRIKFKVISQQVWHNKDPPLLSKAQSAKIDLNYEALEH
jgi:hypothetical protein